MEDDDPDDPDIVVLPKGLVNAPAVVAPAVAPAVAVVQETGVRSPVVIIEDVTIGIDGIPRNSQGLRVGGTKKGMPNDVSETFLSIVEHRRYPGAIDPNRQVIRGDIIDRMLCPSTAQVTLVDECSKTSKTKIKNYDDLNKCMADRHDMLQMGMLKKTKTLAKDKKIATKQNATAPKNATKKTTTPKKLTPVKPKVRTNKWLYPSDEASAETSASSSPAKRKILVSSDSDDDQPQAEDMSPSLPNLSASRFLTKAERKQGTSCFLAERQLKHSKSANTF
ncbi:unnamed protein product [Meganyctiphanes norvegica]|uniref:Uncharacterized protein n=1 Tax=Meganyctiphanes norvegica TaxID=48144 RepID=A0AAV2R6L1_MEGNR